MSEKALKFHIVTNHDSIFRSRCQRSVLCLPPVIPQENFVWCNMNFTIHFICTIALAKKTYVIYVFILYKRHAACDDIDIVRNSKLLKFQFDASVCCASSLIASASDKWLKSAINGAVKKFVEQNHYHNLKQYQWKFGLVKRASKLVRERIAIVLIQVEPRFCRVN
jgi:hypothetical protein